MAHKRNPSRSLLALEAAQRAPGLAATLLGELTPEHERGVGQWQSQWFTLRELLCASASGLAAMGEVLETLQVDEAAMRRNLERSSIPASERQAGFGAAPAMIERVLEDWRAISRGTSP
jgi:3-carboxy-cis,cis-muconate cycloisomerase